MIYSYHDNAMPSDMDEYACFLLDSYDQRSSRLTNFQRLNLPDFGRFWYSHRSSNPANLDTKDRIMMGIMSSVCDINISHKGPGYGATNDKLLAKFAHIFNWAWLLLQEVTALQKELDSTQFNAALANDDNARLVKTVEEITDKYRRLLNQTKQNETLVAIDLPPKRKNGVYFVQESGGGAVKIGVSRGKGGVSGRVKMLQTGNSKQLNLVGFVESKNPYDLESELHETFGDLRIRGEWFTCSPELKLWITENAQL